MQLAEAAAGDTGGWTTGRHYAVPTTDLPVHAHPALLRWFRGVVRDRLGGLLAAQFGAAAVGDGGSRVRIFDAFVVKYCASGGQCYLPVHRDQSTHSFTIALNELSAYRGGGTYFSALGRAVRPERGHVLSFNGDLLHGGDPITWGVRYIVVAFTYIEPAHPLVLSDILAGRLRALPPAAGGAAAGGSAAAAAAARQGVRGGGEGQAGGKRQKRAGTGAGAAGESAAAAAVAGDGGAGGGAGDDDAGGAGLARVDWGGGAAEGFSFGF